MAPQESSAVDEQYMAHAMQLQELSFSSARDLDDDQGLNVPDDGVRKQAEKGWIPFVSDGVECPSAGIWSFSVDSAAHPLQANGKTRRMYPYIETGYRLTPLGLWPTAKSVLQWHNETVNVWTHVFGAVLFVYMFVQLICHDEPFPKDMQLIDCLVFGAYLVSAINCMVLSSAFHLFSSASDEIYEQLEVLDQFGILLLMLGSNLPMIFYGFYERLEWQVTYLTCSVLGVATATLVLRLQRLKEWRGLKLAVFASVALIGWCQLAHDITARGGLEAVASQAALQAWVHTFGWYVAGAALYAGQVPERLWPGAFDRFGASHQLWHVCVVLGALQHLHGSLAYARLAGALAPNA